MALNLYNTAALIGVIAALDRPSSFLLDTYYPQEKVFDTEEVYFDQLNRARRLAPFVSPLVEGKAERSRGYATRTLAPAYVKPKHLVEPSKALARAPGENLGGGQLSAEQKFQMAVTQNLADEDDQITRREEWMAAQELLTGTVTISGEDYPTQVVDFGRDAALTFALTGANRWGQAGINVLDTLRTTGGLIARKSGAAGRLVIMDPMAAVLLQRDTELRAILNNWRQATGLVELIGQPLGAVGEEAQLLGQAGGYEFWQYQSIYTDDQGAELQMLPDNTVIMGSPKMAEGTRAYGAIKDRKAALMPLSRFPKMWDVEDPATTLTMTQSAPLPVLGRPNATAAFTVN